jgi:hypothetical protein
MAKEQDRVSYSAHSGFPEEIERLRPGAHYAEAMSCNTKH